MVKFTDVTVTFMSLIAMHAAQRTSAFLSSRASTYTISALSLRGAWTPNPRMKLTEKERKLFGNGM